MSATHDHLSTAGRLTQAEADAFINYMLDRTPALSPLVVSTGVPCRYKHRDTGSACGRPSIMGAHRCPDHARQREVDNALRYRGRR